MRSSAQESVQTSVDRLFGGSCCDAESVVVDAWFELDGGEFAGAGGDAGGRCI